MVPVGNIGNWAEVKQQALDHARHPARGQRRLQCSVGGHRRIWPLHPRTRTGSRRWQLAAGGFDLRHARGILSSSRASAKTGHAFLDDIAHNAHPKNSQTGVLMTPDADDDVNTPMLAPLPEAGVYDDELLDAHFVTGDGRGNENIGLTAVHTIFHSEHNRLQENIDQLIQTPGFLTDDEVTAWEAIGTVGLAVRRAPVPGRTIRDRDAVPAPRLRGVRPQAVADDQPLHR